MEVRLYVGPPGGSSVGTYYELRVGEDPQPYATGEAVVVFVSMANQKPVRIPDGIRTRIETAEAA